MSTFLIRSATSQSSSYPIVLMRLSGPRSRPNPHLKFVEVPGIERATLSDTLVLAYAHGFEDHVAWEQREDALIRKHWRIAANCSRGRGPRDWVSCQPQVCSGVKRRPRHQCRSAVCRVPGVSMQTYWSFLLCLQIFNVFHVVSKIICKNFKI